MAMLCLNFNGIAQNQGKIPSLKVNDQVPETFWQQEHTVYANGKITKQTLTACKGKLLVLDFWATWCTPCVAALPKVDSLNQAFMGQLQILSVSYQSEKDVAPLAAKMPQLKTLINERYLHQLFPHVYLPHLIWLGTDGKVLAITGQEALNAEKLAAAVKGIAPNATAKTDTIIPFDKTKGLLAQPYPSLNTKLSFSSTLIPHLPNLASQNLFEELKGIKGYRYLAINSSLLALFVFAHSNLGIVNFKYVQNRVKEPLKLIASRKDTDLALWEKQNTYNFELQAASPLITSQKDFFELLRQQLAIYFPAYQCTIIKQRKTVWALTATGPLNQLLSKKDTSYFKKDASGYYLRNFRLSSLVQMLSLHTFQKSEIRLVDNTGFNNKIDLDIVANMNDMADINRALAAQHLQFVKQEMEVPFLLITDASKTHPKHQP